MSRLLNAKPFRVGCLIGLALVSTVNILELLLLLDIEKSSPKNIHVGGVYYFGLPFTIFEWNNYRSDSGQFYFTGLIGNLIATIVFSILLGLAFQYISLKLSARKLK